MSVRIPTEDLHGEITPVHDREPAQIDLSVAGRWTQGTEPLLDPIDLQLTESEDFAELL